MIQRRYLLASAAALPLVSAWAQPDAWARTLAAARGQTVYFNAWGGSERTNAYLQWAGGEVMRLYGVKLEHVKLADTAEAVRRVRAEKAAGRSDGSVDLVWINGENFLTMKREALLFGPWAETLPNFRLVDTQGKPTTLRDFGEPTEGFEAAWGMAQLTFQADGARVPQLPSSFAALVDWARQNPGRFTYPRPPQFLGTTFVKQAALEVAGPEQRALLYRPHTAEAFTALTPRLWAQLDTLHPLLWRGGKQFPASSAVMRQMLADGELHLSLTFNPNEAANQIAAKALPATVQSFQFMSGTIGNTHFVAIPYNARAKDGAMVLANFLQSSAAQSRKADIRHWGDPTVLAVERLPAAERALFDDAVAAPGSVRKPAPVLPEPHASWVEPLEREWLRRYGAG